MRAGFDELVSSRRELAAFSGNRCKIVDVGGGPVLAYVRESGSERALVLCNFSEQAVTLAVDILESNLFATTGWDVTSGEAVGKSSCIDLDPYQYRWVVPATLLAN